MKVLLDETAPRSLHERLRESGLDAEHIAIGRRDALPDAVLLRRLAADELVFLSHDAALEEEIPAGFRSQVIIAHSFHRLSTARRVVLCLAALERLAMLRPPERLFELLPTGELFPWELADFGRMLRRPL